MNRVYKYRLYPNKTQQRMLGTMLFACRTIYNEALAMRIQMYNDSGKTPKRNELYRHFSGKRNAGDELLQTIPADMISFVLMRLEEAYKHFFRRVKNGDAKAGFPKFANRKRYRSFEVWRSCGMLHSFSERWCKLRVGYGGFPVGDVRVRYDRPLPETAKVKTINIREDLDGKWWAAVTLEYDHETPQHYGDCVGVDVGLASLIATSHGELSGNPRWLRAYLSEKRVLLRKLDRQRRANNPQNYNEDGTNKQGVFIWHKSNNMRETERQLRKVEGKIKAQRRLFWDTLSRRLVDEYSLIVLEDLPLDFMIQNKNLALSASDAGIGGFRRMLEYKAEETGAQIIYVPAAYTSQTCSQCGCISKDNRQTQASFVCTDCGHKENADVNAAKVILARGLAQLEQKAA